MICDVAKAITSIDTASISRFVKYYKYIFHAIINYATLVIIHGHRHQGGFLSKNINIHLNELYIYNSLMRARAYQIRTYIGQFGVYKMIRAKYTWHLFLKARTPDFLLSIELCPAF